MLDLDHAKTMQARSGWLLSIIDDCGMNVGEACTLITRLTEEGLETDDHAERAELRARHDIALAVFAFIFGKRWEARS